ncbi:hypothetical protein TeGR_g14737, partial [Tetraparma gracilis]
GVEAEAEAEAPAAVVEAEAPAAVVEAAGEEHFGGGHDMFGCGSSRNYAKFKL